MFQRAALHTWKNCRIDSFCNIGIVGQNGAAAGTSQRLVSRCGNDIGISQRIGIEPACRQSGKMRHVNHQHCSAFMGNGSEFDKVNLPRI